MPNYNPDIEKLDVSPQPYIDLLRVEHDAASSYRLIKKRSGEMMLQGYYLWQSGCTSGGEWKDIPTFEE